MNKVLEAYKKNRIKNLNEQQKEVYKKEIINNILNDVKNKKDRFVFIVPDIDVVNPLVKIMYDLALESVNNGYNTLIVHEKEGFKASWLTGTVKKYNKIKIDFLAKKVGGKSQRLKAGFDFNLSDNLFISDINLEMIQDLNNSEFKNIYKTLIVTGYNGLYTLNPGSNLYKIGIHSTICFDKQVHSDYVELFQFVDHNLVPSYKLSDNSEYISKSESFKKEPYILLSAVGQGEKINQLVNIFYNKFPQLDFIKFKIVDRKSYSYFLNDLKNSILYVNLDRHYVTNFNSLLSWEFNVPYFSTNGFVENSELTSNLLSPDASIDLFQVANYLKNVIINYLNNSEEEFKESLVPNKNILESFKNIFESGIKETYEKLRENKCARIENAIKNAEQQK